MTLFGVYDRAQLAAQGLLAVSGCADAPHITVLADSDQRTRETGKALAAALRWDARLRSKPCRRERRIRFSIRWEQPSDTR